MIYFAISFVVAAFFCLMLIRYSHFHDHITGDSSLGPQKFHSHSVSRVGGLGLAAALIAVGFALFILPPYSVRGTVGEVQPAEFWLLLLCALPAFVSGLAEDLTKRVGIMTRLLATMVAAGLGFVLLGAALERLDLLGVDLLLDYWPVSLALTLIAVGGVANAINIIDGYNGLSGVVALLIFGALGRVAFVVGDPFLFLICFVMVGALAGFLLWNYPNGLIFLGDGGAYLVGFLIGEVSVLLVKRHPEVSPWFPLLLVAYPVWETLFSVYRRKFLRGHSPGAPDALHFHSMVYRRLVRWMVGSKDANHITRRNSKTSPYLWALTLLTVAPAVLFWNHSWILMAFVAAFVILYLWLYQGMVRFRTPRWLSRKRRSRKGHR